MAKADDKGAARTDIANQQKQDQAEFGQGIKDTQSRVDTLQPKADSERDNILSHYQTLADTGGISQADRDTLMNHSYAGSSSGSGSGGGGGGGGGGGAVNTPDYLKTWSDMLGSTGGFDPTRLANITSDSSALRNTSGNYGTTDTAKQNLMDFGKTGGITDEDTARINRPLFEEYEKTGGYSDQDKSLIRDRNNKAVSGFYQNMRDQQALGQAGQAYSQPGMSSTNFKLARQNAQDIGTTSNATELGIADSVRTGRMDAAKAISDNQLRLLPIRTQNQLTGYKSAGDLDLQQQKQIDDARTAAGNLDLGTQGTINQSRLGAAAGTSQDTLGRMSISAQSAAASAANGLYERSLNDQNQRFLMSQGQQGQEFGAQGLLNTYATGPQELEFNQSLLRDYRNDNANWANQSTQDQIQLAQPSNKWGQISNAIGTGAAIYQGIRGNNNGSGTPNNGAGGSAALGTYGPNYTYISGANDPVNQYPQGGGGVGKPGDLGVILNNF
jgi:hypothetical protein